jgi:hypothetical protein
MWYLCVVEPKDRDVDALKTPSGETRRRNQLEPTIAVPEDAPYPVSAAKIGRMWRMLNDNGFASFAEA